MDFRKFLHNSLLVTEVLWLPTLTPLSGCCYCSCLLRTALCLPGTFSLVQRRGQLASYSMCVCGMCVYLGNCVCVLYLCVRVYFTGEHAMYCCTCVFVYSIYIGVHVCHLGAMCEPSAKRADLLPLCY